MSFQVFFGDKLRMVADAAVEIPDTLVTLHVQVELGFLSEGLVAERASMDTPPMLRPRRRRMNAHVGRQAAGLREPLPTNLASVGPCPCVFAHVYPQRLALGEPEKQ